MAVLRSRRALAFSEFERHMGKIHKDLAERMNAKPVRYHKHLCKGLYEPMNRAYDAVIMANEQKGKGRIQQENRERYFTIAVQSIMAMEKPLMAFCNVRGVEQSTIDDFEKRINLEIALIYGAAGWATEGKPVFHSLNRRKFEQLAFLGKMAALHKYTYEKTAHALNYCFDSLSCRIDDFVTNALYCVVMANDKMPETRAEAEKRDAYLKCAIDSLNDMQRPMVGLWNIMDYSENTMNEWSGMIDEEITILTGLRNKDREKYKALPQ